MAAEAMPPAAGGLAAPLRNRRFLRFLGAQFASVAGDLLLLTVLPFVVLDLGGPGDVAFLMLIMGLARIVGAPLGGRLVDRLGPARVMLITNAARGGVLACAAAGLERDVLGIPVLLALMGLVAVLDGMFLPAYWTIVPVLLPEDERVAGNSIAEATILLAVTFGPFVGSVGLKGTSAPWVIAVDAATFLLSGWAMAGLVTGPAERTRTTSDPGPESGSFREFVRGSRLFGVMLAMTAVLHVTFAGIRTVAIPVHLDTGFPDPAESYGFVLTANGAGLLVGSLGAFVIARRAKRGWICVGLLGLHGAAVLALAGAASVPAIAVLMFLVGAAGGGLGVVVLNVLQELVPAAIRGTAIGAFVTVGESAAPLSAALSGVLITSGSPALAFLVAGTGALAAAVIGASQRSVREA